MTGRYLTAAQLEAQYAEAAAEREAERLRALARSEARRRQREAVEAILARLPAQPPPPPRVRVVRTAAAKRPATVASVDDEPAVDATVCAWCAATHPRRRVPQSGRTCQWCSRPRWAWR